MVDYTSLLLKRNTTIEPWIFPSMLLFSCSSGRWFDYIAKYMVVFTWHDDVAGLVVVWRMACWVELGYKYNLVLLLNQTVPVFMHLTVISFFGSIHPLFRWREWLQPFCIAHRMATNRVPIPFFLWLKSYRYTCLMP